LTKFAKEIDQKTLTKFEFVNTQDFYKLKVEDFDPVTLYNIVELFGKIPKTGFTGFN